MGITNPAEQFFKDGGWHWNGSEWIKGGLAFEYYAHWAEELGGVKAGDGSYDQDTTAVPAGEIWVLMFVSLSNEGGQRGQLFFDLMGVTALTRIGYHTSTVRYEPLIVRGPVILAEGDYLKVRQFLCLDGDVIRAGAWGYKMRLT